ncbi:MAG: cytochrome c [Gemmatimonadota bacterium]|nr:cytochrome c [Gemmatimonadota bacterium]MDE2984995.1 cytochrome c [Gemmatimonadota bacterium]
MRRVRAKAAAATAAHREGRSAARHAPRPSGFVRALSGIVLTACLAGCASGGVPEVPPDEAGAASPVSETPAPTPEAPVSAPANPPPTAGIFTASQADRGRTAFDEVCSDCHTTSEFRGRTFQSNWGRRTVYSFFRTIRSTMPDDNPGGLEEETYLDVVTYILRINGHAAGTSEMTAESPMRQVRMAPPTPNP